MRPIKVLIEVTNRCNLARPICHTGRGLLTREKRDLSLVEYLHILSQVSARKILLYNQGEPFLNVDICEMIAATNKMGIKTSISTNGMLLTPEMNRKIVDSKLSCLTISLDGFDQATLEMYRKKADFSQLIENIRDIVSLPRETKIEIQFVIMKHNRHQLDKVRKFAEDLGVVFVAKTVGIDVNDPDFQELAEKYVPEDKSDSRYVRTEKGIISKSERKMSCKLLDREVVILSNGDIVPCCYDFHSDYVMGNVFKENFEAIWFSEKFQRFRENVHQCKMCATCP